MSWYDEDQEYGNSGQLLIYQPMLKAAGDSIYVPNRKLTPNALEAHHLRSLEGTASKRVFLLHLNESLQLNSSK